MSQSYLNRGVRTSISSGCVCTRGEVIGLVARLGLAVQFLLSQLVQQTLVLVFLTRLGCPLLAKVCSAAHTVALLA